MISIANISILIALAGLVIPIAIHLMSIRRRNEVAFGSIRFLQESQSSSSRSIKLSDVGLLLLRCLLIATLILLTSGILLHQDEDIRKQIWVQSELYQNTRYHDLIPTIESDSEIKIFHLGQKDSVDNYASLWSVIADANEEKDSVDIYTFNLMKDYVGSAVAINSDVMIRYIPKIDKSSISWNGQAFDVNSSDHTVRFTKKSDAYLSSRESLNILTTDTEEDIKPLKDLIKEIGKVLDIDIDWNQSDRSYDLILSTTDSSNNKIDRAIIWNNESSGLTFDRLGSQSLLIDGTLNNTNLLTSDLPVVLVEFLMTPEIYDITSDLRSMYSLTQSEAQIQDNSQKAALRSVWWLLILPLLLIERYYSTNSGRS